LSNSRKRQDTYEPSQAAEIAKVVADIGMHVAKQLFFEGGMKRYEEWKAERNSYCCVSRQISKPAKPSKLVRQKLPAGTLNCRKKIKGFRNKGTVGSLVNRVILPSLNRCETCGKTNSDHQEAEHIHKRDSGVPEWHGWHAARRGLGSNLYRLGVPDMVLQRILRHANVSTTATYYIKTAADDVRNAMVMLENHISLAAHIKEGTVATLKPKASGSPDLIRQAIRLPYCALTC
jgi:hypothetical protein